jgi:hypothetical protein
LGYDRWQQIGITRKVVKSDLGCWIGEYPDVLVACRNLATDIDDANARDFQRHVNSDITKGTATPYDGNPRPIHPNDFLIKMKWATSPDGW